MPSRRAAAARPTVRPALGDRHPGDDVAAGRRGVGREDGGAAPAVLQMNGESAVGNAGEGAAAGELQLGGRARGPSHRGDAHLRRHGMLALADVEGEVAVRSG
jgi:hypothetical protein